MKKNSRLSTTFFAFVTAATVAACGADESKKGDSSGISEATKKNPKPVVEVKTSMGAFKVELNREKSPITVANFLKYVGKKHYDGTIFHRVMSDFMVQGGGFEKGDIPTEKKTEAGIKNEARTNGLSNKKYTIAMARTPDPDSATSQFFINVVENGYRLDPNPRVSQMVHGYAVFGKVIEGTEVVDKIKMVEVTVKTLKSEHKGKYYESKAPNVPKKDVVIESIRVVEKKAAKEKPAAEKKDSN